MCRISHYTADLLYPLMMLLSVPMFPGRECINPIGVRDFSIGHNQTFKDAFILLHVWVKSQRNALESSFIFDRKHWIQAINNLRHFRALSV